MLLGVVERICCVYDIWTQCIQCLCGNGWVVFPPIHSRHARSWMDALASALFECLKTCVTVEHLKQTQHTSVQHRLEKMDYGSDCIQT